MGKILKLALYSFVLFAFSNYAQPAIADANTSRGVAVFSSNCAVCHSAAPSENRIGPSLSGVIGRKAGTYHGFNYSQAMTKSGVVWNAETLTRFLRDPQITVPQTRMAFPGVSDDADRAALIEYLTSLK
ncbi:c-type cytochrome [Caballeronia sp. 15711]|uniref:c-type cytochrome n=1 Tax=Caballeronia sp. 15711 TaxID=3391029 RepID=UPI0039E5C8F5